MELASRVSNSLIAKSLTIRKSLNTFSANTVILTARDLREEES